MGNRDDEEPPTDIVFMGGARVGKTSLIHCVLRLRASTILVGRYKATVEDSYVRQFLVGEQTCQLRVVDTAGSYIFPAMQRLWVKRASAFVLVCARDDPASLLHLRDLMKQIREERAIQWKRLLLILVVNKCDLHLDSWSVSDADIEQFADDFQVPYSAIVFTSALMQVGVDRMMRVLWQQNEDSGQRAIRYRVQSKRPLEVNRRSSAFAVLLNNSSRRRRSSSQVETPTENGNRTEASGSFSAAVIPGTRRFFSMSDGSPSWLVRKIDWMRIGSTSRTTVNGKSKRGVTEPAVIDTNCQVS